MRRILAGTATELDQLWLHPEEVFRRRGLAPDQWQIDCAREILTTANILLLCARQCGKSETDAAMALLTILLTPPALILFLAPTHRQAKELLKKFEAMYEPWRALCPMVPGKDNAESKLFVNGSRIEILPDKEQTIRSFSSVALIIIDEATRVSDGVYHTVMPMLSVSRGRIIGSSTAFGQRGWFYTEFIDETFRWSRYNVRGTDCKRHTARFLADERRKKGDRWYKQEWENSFESAVGAVFSPEDIKAAFGRVSEEEAWLDLFGAGGGIPQPNIVDAKTIEM